MTKFIFLIILLLIMISGSIYADDKPKSDEMSKGRINLVLTSSAYAAGLYGWGIPYLLNADSTRAYVGSEMVSVFSAFSLTLLATKNYNYGPAVSRMIQGGALIGTAYGLGVPALLGSDNENHYIAVPMLTTPLGALAGFNIARRGNINESTAELTIFGSIIGGLYGLAVPYLINVDDLSDTNKVRAYAGAMMAGIPIGALSFNEISQRLQNGKSRARLIELGTCMGAYYGYGFVLLADPESKRPYVASMILGLPVGTGLSYLITSDGNYEHGRSILIILGTLFGELFGRGVAYLLGADSWRTSTIGGMLGAPAGTVISSMLTRNLPETSKIDQKTSEYSKAVDLACKIGILGTYSIVARNGKSIPIYMELYKTTF